MKFNHWIRDLYENCTEVLNEKEREIYFAYELGLANEKIEKILNHLETKKSDPLEFHRVSEALQESAFHRAVLDDCVQDVTLKDEIDSIPKDKLETMTKLFNHYQFDNVPYKPSKEYIAYLKAEMDKGNKFWMLT